ncbi:short chain dehydrogenase [Sarocladium strictum]
MASESLTGHTVAITGGAGGLGKAIATAFLSKGANVAICDVNQDRLTQCETEWSSNYPGKFLASKTDITDESGVESFITAIVTKFDRLDMVVNNAGIIDNFDPVGTTSKETWDRVMGINLTGMFLISKAAVNAMEAQSPPGGTIINIGSVASYRGVNGGFAYTVSKHGVVGITKNIAGYYMDKGINSIALLLGGMDDTNLSDNFLAGINQDGMMRIGSANPGYTPGKTNVQLADVAKYCVFLADRDIAASSNGGVITFNKNWPVA